MSPYTKANSPQSMALRWATCGLVRIPEALNVMRATLRVWQLQFTESRYINNCAVEIFKNVHKKEKLYRSVLRDTKSCRYHGGKYNSSKWKTQFHAKEFSFLLQWYKRPLPYYTLGVSFMCLGPCHINIILPGFWTQWEGKNRVRNIKKSEDSFTESFQK